MQRSRTRAPRPVERPKVTEADAPEEAPLVIQRRLQVGASNDRYEREADRVADEVIRRLGAGQATTDAEAPVATTATGVRRRKDAASSGQAFEAPDHVERAIAGARSGGSPLDGRTRARFEGAMGVDLGEVRVHHDAAADQLNREVSAKAFTAGQHVFFSEGSYRPGTSEGEHLLAHELTHTLQQSGSAQRAVVRRMTVASPAFDTTTLVNVFSGGASGNVAMFSDGKGGKVIVKVDQLIGNEVAVADQLATRVGKSKKDAQGFGVAGPGSRVATPAERKAIKAAALAHIPTGADPRNFLTGLDSPNPVIIAEAMGGQKFKDFTGKDQLLKDDGNGGKEIDPNSVALKLLTSAPALSALAQAVPADILMGMGDRIIGTWNAENFLYDPATQSFNFVDNTQNAAHGYLTSVMTDTGLASHRSAFDAWCAEPRSKLLQKADFKALAANMLTTIQQGLSYSFNNLRKVDRGHIAQMNALFESAKPKLLAAIIKGLSAGHANLLSELKNPLALTAGVSPDARLEAVESLLARYHFLKKLSPDKAWVKAGKEAAKLFASLPKAPARPKSPLPAPPPGASSSSSSAGGASAPSTPWQSAQPAGRGSKTAMGAGGRMPKLPSLPGS